MAHEPRRGRQPVENHRAVPLGHHTRVQQYDRPYVAPAANQASEPLLELEGGIRDQVVHEAVQAPRLQALQPRGRERLRRHLEGKLREDQHPQRAPRHVNALPEGVGSQENPRAGLPEASQQVVALSFALHEQRPPAADRVAHRVRRAPQRRVTREQHEHAAVGRVGQLQEDPSDGGAVARFVVARLGEIGGDPEQTLRGVVEGRRVDLAHLGPRRRQVQSEPLLEVSEVASRRESGAREHHRLGPVEQVLLEDGRQIEGHGGEGDVRGFPPASLEPADRRGAGGRWPQRRRETRSRRVQPPHHSMELGRKLRAPLRGIVERQPVGDHRRALGETRKPEQQIIERYAQPFVPHRIREELVAQPEHRRRTRLAVEPSRQPGEDVVRRTARRYERVAQTLLRQLATRRRH